MAGTGIDGQLAGIQPFSIFCIAHALIISNLAEISG
jgi:hypothetical protein